MRRPGIPMNTTPDFDRIYKAFFPRIHRYIIRMTGPFQAEDLTQEVFSKVHRGLPGFKGGGLSAWIYRIATRTAIDRARTRAFKADRNALPLAGRETKDNARAGNGETEASLIKQEMNACIREFIRRLPEKYSTVLILSQYEHKTNQEIAEILDISLDTVKIRRHRAKARLKDALSRGCNFYYDDQNILSCDRKQPPGILQKHPD